MNNTPEISVIVPIYKVEKYLPQCIDSILAQTFTNFELLLIDDGSPDRCGAICEEYARKDERIRVFRQENAGVSIARNKGLFEAQGKYVAFVDSDDYVLPEYLQELYNELPKDGLRGVIIESVVNLYPDGVKKPYILPRLDFSKSNIYCVLTDLTDKNVGYPHSKLYCIDIIKEHHILFIPTVSLLEDFFFLLDYIQYADYVLVRNISNYVYRVGHSLTALSICSRSLDAEYAVFLNYYDRIIRYKQEYNLSLSDFRKPFKELRIFFHRAILAMYTYSEKSSYKCRKAFLRQFVSTYPDWVENYFMPDYLADRVAKKLLVRHLYLGYDLWMRFLLAIKFKYMFGSKK